MIQDALDAMASLIAENLSIPAYAYVPLNVPVKPAAVLMIEDVTYNRASQNSLTEVNVIVGIVIGRSDEETSQRLAHEYAAPTGDNSLKAAIESDRTLDATAKDCVVQSSSEISYADIANDSVLVLQFNVLVYL